MVFADVDPETGLMLPENLLAAIEAVPEKLQAIFTVHLNGQIEDQKQLNQLLPNIACQSLKACHTASTEYSSEVGASSNWLMQAFRHLHIFFHPVKGFTSVKEVQF